MNRSKYHTITTIKESSKGIVTLAMVDGYDDPVIVKRMRNANTEVYKMLSGVRNVHIPRIYSWEQQGDELIVVEEYIDGEILKFYIENDSLTNEQKLSVALQLSEAVEVLHGCRTPIIHRDIKPSNILITEEGVVKLIDFDASRKYKEESDIRDTRILGTVEYAAPEQYGYTQTDVRSDIYSMGVVFSGLGVKGNIIATAAWKRIVDVCTSFDPKKRYKNVKSLAKSIRRVISLQKYMYLYLCGILCVGVLLGVGGWFGAQMQGEIPETEGIISPSVVPAESSPTLPKELTDNKMDAIAEDLDKKNVYVYNYYQGEKDSGDLLFYSTFFEIASEVIKAELTDQTNGNKVSIPREYYRFENSIFIIDEEYMQTLENTYYMLNVRFTKKKGRGETGFNGYWKICPPENSFTEGNVYLMNDILDYGYKEYDVLHLVLASDTRKKITGLYQKNSERIPEEQYKILYDGRALELSAELLEPCKNQVKTMFYVEFETGEKELLTVENPYLK